MNKYKAKRLNGKKFDEHRLIFEKHLGRKLTKEEIVHHIDGDKSNNDINNLMLFPTKSVHTKYHYEKGDLKIKVGENKKELINGKLKCSKCGKLKEIKEFLTDAKHYLGVRSICKDCYSQQRKNWR